MLRSPAVFLALATVYPPVFLIRTNSHLYEPRQVSTTLAFIALVAFLAWGAAAFVEHSAGALAARLFRGPRREDARRRVARVVRGATSAAGAGVLLLSLALPLLAIVHDRSTFAVVFVTAAALFFLVGALGDLRVPNLVLGCLILVNVVTWLSSSVGRGAAGTAEAGTAAGVQLPVFGDRPNVYLVVLESYNSLGVRRDEYGIDNTALVAGLERHRFTIYPGVHTNYFSTLFSLSSTLSMRQHHYHDYRGIADGGGYRKVIGGVAGNRVVETFAKNGYEIDYSGFPSVLFHPGPLLSRFERPRALQPLELNRMFSWLLPGQYRSAPWDVEEALAAVDRVASSASGGGADKRPIFALLYAGARHGPDDWRQYPASMREIPGFAGLRPWQANQVNGYWLSTYREAVAASDPHVIDLVGRIAANDPSAVVILLGDHGAWRYGDVWAGPSSDPNTNMKQHGVRVEDVTRDLFEVFLAVRWPPGQERRLSSPVNLFRHVFAALAGDPGVPGDREPDDAFAYVATHHGVLATARTYRTVRDGTVLARWEEYRTAR